MKKTILNKRERMSRNDMIAAGLEKHCPKAVILNDGQSVKAADAMKLLKEASNAEKKATASRAQFLADVEAARAAESKVKAIIPAIKNLVSGSFGKKSPVMAEFGFGPEANKVTAEVRYEAVEKLRATRAARGTMGSRQKAAIHGSVETAASAPVVATPAPSQPAVTTPAPAPVATSGVNGTNGAAAPALFSLNGSSH